MQFTMSLFSPTVDHSFFCKSLSQRPHCTEVPCLLYLHESHYMSAFALVSMHVGFVGHVLISDNQHASPIFCTHTNEFITGTLMLLCLEHSIMAKTYACGMVGNQWEHVCL
jgi:hypothetical protein